MKQECQGVSREELKKSGSEMDEVHEMNEEGNKEVYILPRCLLITGQLREARTGCGRTHELQKTLNSTLLSFASD